MEAALRTDETLRETEAGSIRVVKAGLCMMPAKLHTVYPQITQARTPSQMLQEQNLPVDAQLTPMRITFK